MFFFTEQTVNRKCVYIYRSQIYFFNNNFFELFGVKSQLFPSGLSGFLIGTFSIFFTRVRVIRDLSLLSRKSLRHQKYSPEAFGGSVCNSFVTSSATGNPIYCRGFFAKMISIQSSCVTGADLPWNSPCACFALRPLLPQQDNTS